MACPATPPIPRSTGAATCWRAWPGAASLEDFDRLASQLPCLVNLQPSGEHLMEDFCYAGGLPVLMNEIAHLLHTHILTASGKTVGENIADAQNYDPRVIKTFDAPFKAKAGIAFLRGKRGAFIPRDNHRPTQYGQ